MTFPELPPARHGRIALLATLAALVVAAPAHAVTGTAPDPAGDIPPSFAPSTDTTGATVTFQGSTLSVSVSYAAPPVSDAVDLLVAGGALEEENEGIEKCDPDAANRLEVAIRGGQAVLTVNGIDGQLTAPATRSNATTVTTSFTAPALARQFAAGDPFACIGGEADGDELFGAFPGKTIKLTPLTARAGAEAELAKRFGARFRDSTRQLVRCPPQRILPAGDGTGINEGMPMVARARCAFQFKQNGRTDRHGEMQIHLDGGRTVASAFYSFTLPTGLTHCGTTDFSAGSGPAGRRWAQPPIPEDFAGASMSVFARRVPCTTAQSLASRWNGRRSYRRYRCARIASAYESLTVRCTRGKRQVRWTTGA